jgi:Flp pilus assembly protein TadD
VKAFYAMSGLVPLCALLALGFEVVLKRRSYLSWPIMLVLGIWAMNAYATFWVIRDSPAVHARLGRMAVTSEERERVAEQHLSAALKGDPDNALAQLGKVLLLNKRGELLEAVTEVRKLLETHPDHALGQKMLAIYLDSLNLPDESVAHARRAAQLAPGDQMTWFLLGKAEIQRGEDESAARALRQSLRIAPSYAEAHQSLATLLQSQGKVQEAAYHFRLAQQKPKLR